MKGLICLQIGRFPLMGDRSTTRPLSI